MAVTAVWSDEAKRTFDDNIRYLEKEWTEKEIRKFVLRSAFVIDSIEKQPELYPASVKSKKIRKAVVNKHITLYYRHYPSRKMVVLLSFWNNNRNPKKRKF